MTGKAWMVRAGRNGRFFDQFREQGIVAIGWREVGDVIRCRDRDEVIAATRAAYPTFSEQAVLIAASQIYRFITGFKPGDRLVTYDPRARQYLCGVMLDGLEYQPEEETGELTIQRKVKWQHEKSRDELSLSARNSLGSLSTIFAIAPEVAEELWASKAPDKKEAPSQLPALSESDQEPDIEQIANEAIKDRIAGLDWQQMQELVAGLLRAMGYKTQVSPPGADRGKDIVASPDGFGFQEPRIVVEVKHRKDTRMGSQEIRSFLGGRHPRDKGLFVSTGGFSREAYYEAERASIPLTLMDFEGLVEAIQQHYGGFDESTRQILPLKAIYLPIVN